MSNDEELKPYSEINPLVGDISASLQVPESTVKIFDEGKFYPSARFSYGFVEANASHGPGFIKIGKGESALQIEKEFMANKLAEELGLPTVTAFDFKITDKGNATIYLARLSSEEGLLLVDDEMIAAADPSFGERAAHALIVATAKTIEQPLFEKYSPYIKQDEARTINFASFKKEWMKELGTVIDHKYDIFSKVSISEDDLISITRNLEETAFSLIENADGSGNNYYYHGDAHPRNTFFPSDNSHEAILLDLEQSGSTKNRVLAMITDYGDFYNRSWPNPEMQKTFIITIFDGLSQENKEFAYMVAKAAIIVGTIHASQYYMENDHPLHQKALALLNNLQANLDSLELAYTKDQNIN